MPQVYGNLNGHVKAKVNRQRLGSLVAMHALRRSKLQHLLDNRYKGSREQFLKDSGLSKGRLSQLLDPELPFGDVAARNLEERLRLEPGYFDAMDAQTVAFAVQFDALPQHQKAQWLELVTLLSGKGAAPT
jgi:hypothetical protein